MCFRVTKTSGRGASPDPRTTFRTPQGGRPTWSVPGRPRPRAWTARRTRHASVRHAESALACHTARAASLARTFIQTARPALMTRRLQLGVTGGTAPRQLPPGTREAWPRRVCGIPEAQITAGDHVSSTRTARSAILAVRPNLIRPSRNSGIVASNGGNPGAIRLRFGPRRWESLALLAARCSLSESQGGGASSSRASVFICRARLIGPSGRFGLPNSHVQPPKASPRLSPSQQPYRELPVSS